ncbi:mannose-1-phosphate guanylyltransferase [Clostridium polyendosporum]|uniref:mannose-1-phosphate guanylyltransferase n=1 Tax=Clostridium polyendosporum TaxID=69208 RepID=A0A919RVQ7_9CLOT|nr:mannose-1-phosphate guanylyltransferase [Clostridium polyendosporum]GIM27372.1 mannose-1-phosphate guanylyltransferase [Clostridium polyendosporum]
MLCALIMAGGKGTRFWPLSTEDKPKQFLNLLGNETMIQMTVNRIKPLIPLERIFICTVEKYVPLVKEQLPELPQRNIIVEPEGRNTAPCIALSSFIIDRYYKNSTMVVLPSDHLINDEDRFLQIIRNGREFLNDYPREILTLGMAPDRAETGYGYIKCSEDIININNNQVIKVQKFVEKPNKDKAEQYLKEGNYLWNGGMFLWKVERILRLLRENMPSTYHALSGLKNIEEDLIFKYVNENYSKTEVTSIDYGILEKVDSIRVIPCNFGWDDIGSWNSLERYREKDKNQNICDENIKVIDSTNNIGIGHKKPIVFYGLEDVFYVETDELIVIAKKEKMNDIKILKEKILGGF